MDKWGSSVAKATAMELVHSAGVATKSRRELQLCGKTLHIGVGEVQRHITPITARFFRSFHSAAPEPQIAVNATKTSKA
jgi:hypothetical protein